LPPIIAELRGNIGKGNIKVGIGRGGMLVGMEGLICGLEALIRKADVDEPK
jgi:hypothetical protein